jgi:hypothetical protein
MAPTFDTFRVNPDSLLVAIRKFAADVLAKCVSLWHAIMDW